MRVACSGGPPSSIGHADDGETKPKYSEILYAFRKIEYRGLDRRVAALHVKFRQRLGERTFRRASDLISIVLSLCPYRLGRNITRPS